METAFVIYLNMNIADDKKVLKLNALFKRKQKLNRVEIDSTIQKIRAEYDKFIITFHKPISVKSNFEQRYKEALIHSIDMERFLRDEIYVVKSIYENEKNLEKNRLIELEIERKNKIRRTQPDFADRILKELKDKVTVYPSVSIHKDASYEIIHLYGAINYFEKHHWPQLDKFIEKSQNWALRGEKKDFNNEIWRFISSEPDCIPQVLERYVILLNSTSPTLKEVTREAQECIKKAAFLLNDIASRCQIMIKKGVDSSEIEKHLDFVLQIIDDFRIKDFKK